MTPSAGASGWRRRARPLLGTLLEVAVDGQAPEGAAEAAFAAVAQAQRCLSRFEPGSDLSRLAVQPVGLPLRVHAHTARVLRAAQALHAASAGRFDVALGSGRWRVQAGRVTRLDATVRLDLGGIAKGYAIDLAVAALRRAGARAGWVNAGGDLRAFGGVALPLVLRDESAGGVRELGTLCDGAFATSRYAPGSRCRLHGAGSDGVRHVSVAAPRALWADALTKLVALQQDGYDPAPLLRRLRATAWTHA